MLRHSSVTTAPVSAVMCALQWQFKRNHSAGNASGYKWLQFQSHVKSVFVQPRECSSGISPSHFVFPLWHFTCAGQFGPRTGLRCVSMYIDSKCLAAIGWHGKSQCCGHLRGCTTCSVRNKLLLNTHRNFVRDQCAGEMWLPRTTLRRLAEERQPKPALVKLSRAWLFNGCSAGMFPSAWSTGVESGLLLLETF